MGPIEQEYLISLKKKPNTILSQVLQKQFEWIGKVLKPKWREKTQYGRRVRGVRGVVP